MQYSWNTQQENEVAKNNLYNIIIIVKNCISKWCHCEEILDDENTGYPGLIVSEVSLTSDIGEDRISSDYW